MRYEKEYFSEIVKQSRSLSEVARLLGIIASKGNRDTIKIYIERYKLNTEHFSFVRNRSYNNKIKTLEEILVENSDYSRTALKKRLYKSGLKEKECELCNQGELWYGNKMTLILDHINGDNRDNRLINLRIVCPNCNATLDTHCSKNKSKYRAYLCVEKDDNKCIDCDTIISENCKRCIKCDHLRQRKVKRPDIDILRKEILEFGYVKTGKKYGVSDNAIRKWIK